jgi:hypothetical protein
MVGRSWRRECLPQNVRNLLNMKKNNDHPGWLSPLCVHLYYTPGQLASERRAPWTAERPWALSGSRADPRPTRVSACSRVRGAIVHGRGRSPNEGEYWRWRRAIANGPDQTAHRVPSWPTSPNGSCRILFAHSRLLPTFPQGTPLAGIARIGPDRCRQGRCACVNVLCRVVGHQGAPYGASSWWCRSGAMS